MSSDKAIKFFNSIQITRHKTGAIQSMVLYCSSKIELLEVLLNNRDTRQAMSGDLRKSLDEELQSLKRLKAYCRRELGCRTRIEKARQESRPPPKRR